MSSLTKYANLTQNVSLLSAPLICIIFQISLLRASGPMIFVGQHRNHGLSQGQGRVTGAGLISHYLFPLCINLHSRLGHSSFPTRARLLGLFKQRLQLLGCVE